MEWSCQLLTLPEPVIQSMNFWRLSLPFEYWLFLALIMTVFKFKNPECHLQNQVGKRSNSNNLANLGNTKKVWCDKNDITSCYFWLFFSPRFSALPVYSKSQRFWAWDSLRKPWNFVLYFTQGKWLDSLVIEIHLSCELRFDFLAAEDRATVNAQLQRSLSSGRKSPELN